MDSLHGTLCLPKIQSSSEFRQVGELLSFIFLCFFCTYLPSFCSSSSLNKCGLILARKERGLNQNMIDLYKLLCSVQRQLLSTSFPLWWSESFTGLRSDMTHMKPSVDPVSSANSNSNTIAALSETLLESRQSCFLSSVVLNTPAGCSETHGHTDSRTCFGLILKKYHFF